MKKLNCFLSIFSLFFLLTGCSSTQKAINQTKTAYGNRCKGVTSLNWKEQIQGGDANTIAKFVTDLSVAAQADAKKSEDLKGSANANVKVTSDIAKVINQNVKQTSIVSEEFWEQENTFGESLCVLLTLLDNRNVSKNQKMTIIDDIQKLVMNLNEYSLNKKKMNHN